jgi:hypothetical protein
LVGKCEGNSQPLWSGHREASLAQDLGQWRVLVKIVIKRQVPLNGENLTSSVAITRQQLLHGISVTYIQ